MVEQCFRNVRRVVTDTFGRDLFPGKKADGCSLHCTRRRCYSRANEAIGFG
jgi:hypothetical protein